MRNLQLNNKHPMIPQKNSDGDMWRDHSFEIDRMRREQIDELKKDNEELTDKFSWLYSTVLILYAHIDKYGLDYGVRLDDGIVKEINDVILIHNKMNDLYKQYMEEL